MTTDKEKLIDSLLMARNCALQIGCGEQDTTVYNLGKYLDKKLEKIEEHLEKKYKFDLATSRGCKIISRRLGLGGLCGRQPKCRRLAKSNRHKRQSLLVRRN